MRWVPFENLHVTMLFLGELSLEEAADLGDDVGEAIADLPPVPLHFSGVGAFPSIDRPRTIWLGLESGLDEIRELHARMTAVVVEQNISVERRAFLPHVTLGRLHGRSGQPTEDLAATLTQARDVDAGDAVASHVTLFQSEIHRSVPVYTPLAKFPLDG